MTTEKKTTTAGTRSGNPAKKAAAKKAVPAPQGPVAPSSASEFKKNKKGKLLLLPSGLTVTARRVDLQSFIRRGEVPNALLPIVEEALAKGKEMDTAKMVSGDKVSMEMVNDMFNMVEQVTIETVIAPRIQPVPTDDRGMDIPIDSELRDEDTVYIDEVDPEDKMFLFQWATGGTEDLASFREEASSTLAALDQS
jgi:hypothetical protein